MKIKKKILSWGKVERLCSKIVQQIQDKNDYDFIFGIGTGGYIPMALIAKKIAKKETRVVNVRSFVGEKRGPLELEYFPVDIELNGKKILLIDDIVASGATMLYVKKMFTDRRARVVTASLVVSSRVCPKEAYPDLFGEAIFRKKNELIFFPWD